MKTRKLTPRNVAPVKRENVATVSRDGSAIDPTLHYPDINVPRNMIITLFDPFAGNNAD